MTAPTAPGGLDFSSASEWNGRFMATKFTPTRKDIDRYKHLRMLGTELTQEIVHTVPGQAWDDIGEAIGIPDRDQLDNEHAGNVLADCCIYDWVRNGKNVMQRFSESHPEKPGTDEDYVMQAYLRAEYRIVAQKSAIPGAGVYCRDVRTQDELFVMDLSLSRSGNLSGMALAARLVPLGEYWITTGAGLPVFWSDELEAGARQLDRLGLWNPVQFVRMFLAAGLHDIAGHDDTGMKPRQQRSRVAPAVHPTDLCPCRSGLMYKYCCGRVKAAAVSKPPG
jgi:hypothetical protein